jgi:glutamyl-tRNA synthetase
MEDLTFKKKVKLCALENAVKFNGKANQGAVIGKLMSLDPNIKNQMKNQMGTFGKEISKIVSDVNSIDAESQIKELLKYDPDYFKSQKELKEKRKEERHELPELKDVVYGKVVTRISPEPSKYNHFGHAVSFLFNYMYAQKYGGKSILRYEDTNPEKSAQEYVDAMNEDVLNYLDIKADKTIFVSDHIGKYYELAKTAIDTGNAYTCICTSEMISKDRKEMKDCPCRNKSRLQIESEWKDMLAGKYEDGAITLRLKIDMQHKNAVMRDPVIFRLSYVPHYRQGSKYKVWPMYDFENSVEEGMFGITHVFRSNEFESRIELQNYIRDLFKLSHPTIQQYARFNITGAVTQGREIRKLIESGEYTGWDDIRLVTLRALKRRGIVKETFYELAKVMGMSKSVSNLDFSVIAAINRKILDESASRFFFIEKHVLIEIKGAPSQEVELDLHPNKIKGGRKLKSENKFYLESNDISDLKDGEYVRLMGCLNFQKKWNEFVFTSLDYEDYKKTKSNKIIHWIPKGEEVRVEILMPDNSIITGIAEKNIKSITLGKVIQFERFAFCRFDSIKDDGTRVFWYTHN